ncbi:MAG: DNA repair protein RadA [Bacteroidia bacterium]
MSKIKTTFFCQNCGAQAPKWIGKCSSCGQWDTYAEEVVESGRKKELWKNINSRTGKPLLISEINLGDQHRITLPDQELNRVLGGGLVQGSLVLLGGEPGIGKSTLLLQLALQLKNKNVLYVTGEESGQQIRMRAERIGSNDSQCQVLTETSIDILFRWLAQNQPEIIIIDSIQTLYTEKIESAPGSVSQIRECAGELMRYAKETGTAVFLIGHITKDGMIAGPKVLEHMVDVVLQFEGDRHHIFRILRAVKNRFGSTAELGIYEMLANGLRQVDNPSEILISNHDEMLSGISIACTMDGMRPLMIETQALVSSAVYGTPQRSATGFDLRRLNMLLAVLEKRCGFRLGSKDVFLNIAGGIKVEDPAIDLSVICSVLSSNQDIPIHPKTCLTGEVGLSGEIRPVNRIEQRIKEAAKLGFEKIYFSRYNLPSIDKGMNASIELIPVNKVEEIFTSLFS